MNKKIKKVIGIVLVIGLVAFGVCQVVIPVKTQEFVNVVWNWLNQPLPLVGVSALAFCALVVKIVSMTTVGQGKINELKELYAEKQKESDDKVKELVEVNKELKEQIETYKDYLVKVCESIKNVKVQEIGKELVEYGKEKLNSETKAEEI